MPIKQLTNNLIRDITKVGFMPKSEARRRIQEIIDLTCKDMLVEEREVRYDERFVGRTDIGFNQCCALQRQKGQEIKSKLK